jgi:peptidoglycan hydrolase-like protein with peptidoglycan-binding domain
MKTPLFVTAGIIAATLATGAFAAGTAPAATTAPAPAATTAAPATTAPSVTPAPAKAVKAQHAMSKDRVQAIQTALNNNGEKLTVDGHMGPKTKSALKDFQQKHGIKATGAADQATLQQLKV